MRKRKYLFIGGPQHAQYLDVEEAPASVAIADEGVPPSVGDPNDQDAPYPDVLTFLQNATYYTRREVAHVSNEDGSRWRLRVYVWECVADPQQAMQLLGDALAHRYFIEHGTKVDTPKVPAIDRLIIPGRPQ